MWKWSSQSGVNPWFSFSSCKMSTRRRGQQSGLSRPHRGDGLASESVHPLPWVVAPAPSFLPARQGSDWVFVGWAAWDLPVQIKNACLNTVTSAHIRARIEQAVPLKPAPGSQRAVWSPLSGWGGASRCQTLRGLFTWDSCLLRELVPGCRALPVTGLGPWVVGEEGQILILGATI